MKILSKKMMTIAFCTFFSVAGGFLFQAEPVANAADQSVSYPTGQELQKASFVDSFAKINAEDVIVRSMPSTAGDILGVLGKDTQIGIVDIFECKDKNAAILNVDKGSIDFDGEVLTLYRGMALNIVEEYDDAYFVEVKANGRTYGFEVNKSDARKIYGEIWYQIAPNPNYEIPGGYVFGDYVTFI